MLPIMVFCSVTKLNEMNLNITTGSKELDWVRSFHFWPESEHRFGSGRNQCIKCYREWFLHSNETDANEPKHHYWVQKSGLGAFVSGPNRSIVSVPTRIRALNATEHGFLHSNETDRNEPKHHCWVQKSGLCAFVSFLARIGPSFCVPARISALNATEHGFLHSNETDRNKPKHHYWVQKSGLSALVSFLARISASLRFQPE